METMENLTGRVFGHYSEVPAELWRWKNFAPSELACRGTGELMIDEPSLDKLQALRDLLKKPIYLNSAYRSSYWNARCGGVPNSQHLKAKAFDCRMRGFDPYEFQDAAAECGFTAFGHYPDQKFMHIDNRGTPARWYDPCPFPKG